MWVKSIAAVAQAVDFENQRNRSSGIADGAGAARHLANATREFELLVVGRSDLFNDSTD
jgi:hypothetical protein